MNHSGNFGFSWNSPLHRKCLKILRTTSQFPKLGTALSANAESRKIKEKCKKTRFFAWIPETRRAVRAVPKLGNLGIVRKIFWGVLRNGLIMKNNKIDSCFMGAKIDVRKIFSHDLSTEYLFKWSYHYFLPAIGRSEFHKKCPNWTKNNQIGVIHEN